MRYVVLICAVLVCAASNAQRVQTPQRGSKSGTRGNVPIHSGPENSVRPTFAGEVKSISGKQFYIAVDAGNELKFLTNSKTQILDGDKKLKLSDLSVGQYVSVDAQFEPDGTYGAVVVRVEQPKSPTKK